MIDKARMPYRLCGGGWIHLSSSDCDLTPGCTWASASTQPRALQRRTQEHVALWPVHMHLLKHEEAKLFKWSLQLTFRQSPWDQSSQLECTTWMHNIFNSFNFPLCFVLCRWDKWRSSTPLHRYYQNHEVLQKTTLIKLQAAWTSETSEVLDIELLWKLCKQRFCI